MADGVMPEPNTSRTSFLDGRSTAHLCIDMQRLFDETAWRTPWMRRVLPRIAAICEAHAERTIFTRFIPPESPESAPGAWRDYYIRWAEFTRARLAPDLLDLLPELSLFTPPALIVDKAVYSPWFDGTLHHLLQEREITTLVITGAETDVCVLAAVLGAIDRGYRIVVATDAVCGSSDETHDRVIGLYHQRFSQQVETAEVAEILDLWWAGSVHDC